MQKARQEACVPSHVVFQILFVLGTHFAARTEEALRPSSTRESPRLVYILFRFRVCLEGDFKCI